LVRIAIFTDEMMLNADITPHDPRPIDCINVAQMSIVLDTDGTADDPLQVPETQIFQIRIFEDDYRVIVE
jgi:hypothetical protein